MARNRPSELIVLKAGLQGGRESMTIDISRGWKEPLKIKGEDTERGNKLTTKEEDETINICQMAL